VNVFKGIICAFVSSIALLNPAYAEYPERDVLGVIMWGAGGGTDTVSRAVNELAAEALGQPIVLSNKPGGGGAISTAFLDASRADGYTLLYGAENPQIHGVLGVSEIDYLDFYPIQIFGRGLAVISVASSSPYNTLQDLLDDIRANPGTIRMGSTGASGLPSTIAAIISQATDFEISPVVYGGEGPGIEAMLRGSVDFVPFLTQKKTKSYQAFLQLPTRYLNWIVSYPGVIFMVSTYAKTFLPMSSKNLQQHTTWPDRTLALLNLWKTVATS